MSSEGRAGISRRGRNDGLSFASWAVVAGKDPKPSSATVLVVEDHDDSRELLVMLFSDAGYRVAAASTAYEALEHLRAGGVQFVITDYNLEGSETGAWLVEAAALEGLLDDAGVAICTALPNMQPPAHISRVLLYRKPLDVDVLLADVARAIARPSMRGLRVMPPLSA